MGDVPSQLGLQFRKNGSELVICRRLLRPLNDEALLIRSRRLRDNVEVDVVHELIMAQSIEIHAASSWSATSVEAVLLSVVLYPHLMRDASIILSPKKNNVDR